MTMCIIKPTKVINHTLQEEKVMGEIISAIIGISYFVLGYWSVGETIYANKVIIGRIGDMWIQRFLIGAMFGWILIPVALIKRWLFR